MRNSPFLIARFMLLCACNLGMLLCIFLIGCMTDTPTLMDPLPPFSKVDSIANGGKVSIHWAICNKEEDPLVSLRFNVLLPEDRESDSTLLVESMWMSPDYFTMEYCFDIRSEDQGPFLFDSNSYFLTLQISNVFPSEPNQAEVKEPKFFVDYGSLSFWGDDYYFTADEFSQYCFKDPLWKTEGNGGPGFTTNITLDIQKIEGKWKISIVPTSSQVALDWIGAMINDVLKARRFKPEEFHFSYSATIEDVR